MKPFVSNLILNIDQHCQTTDRYHFDKLVSVPHVKLNWILIYAVQMGARKRHDRTIRRTSRQIACR